MIEQKKLELIKRHYLFADMSEQHIQEIAQTSRVIDYASGAIMFSQGENAAHFYMVLSGQIKLTRLTMDGNEKVIEIITPGQTFAEAVMFMKRENYPVTATCVMPTSVISFQNKCFMQILRSSNETCINLLGDLAMRLRGRLMEIENLTMKNATYRVVRYFILQLEGRGSDKHMLELPIQKQLIASRLSITPETLSRILHTLTESGIIENRGKTIVIPDFDRLTNYS